MTDFYSQNRCVCSTRSHGPLLCAFCLSFHFNAMLATYMVHWIMCQVADMPNHHFLGFNCGMKRLAHS